MSEEETGEEELTRQENNVTVFEIVQWMPCPSEFNRFPDLNWWFGNFSRGVWRRGTRAAPRRQRWRREHDGRKDKKRDMKASFTVLKDLVGDRDHMLHRQVARVRLQTYRPQNCLRRYFAEWPLAQMQMNNKFLYS